MASGGLVVEVEDVDAHYQRARAAGAQIKTEPQDQLYAQRGYEARDLEGHRWWFASALPQQTSEAQPIDEANSESVRERAGPFAK